MCVFLGISIIIKIFKFCFQKRLQIELNIFLSINTNARNTFFLKKNLLQILVIVSVPKVQTFSQLYIFDENICIALILKACTKSAVPGGAVGPLTRELVAWTQIYSVHKNRSYPPTGQSRCHVSETYTAPPSAGQTWQHLCSNSEIKYKQFSLLLGLKHVFNVFEC